MLHRTRSQLLSHRRDFLYEGGSFLPVLLERLCGLCGPLLLQITPIDIAPGPGKLVC